MDRDDKAMLYHGQALDDQRAPADNQAMLDEAKSSTSATVKAQLAKAFSEWDGSGGPKTKKRLAELCEKAVHSKRTCSPQAVNGWFSTGRIDKYWLPVVSSVLGRQIGVVVDLVQPTDRLGVGTIFSRLSALIRPLNGHDRKLAKAILEDFVMKPEDHERMAAQMTALLGGSQRPRVAPRQKTAA